ncbi:MAG: prepilin-type N-terminal cleavage/methylation domain-containing protein [Phycisphaeraceae bacterium]|nr:prepilin-type N-terminal cleavage/methylation domain-containing protein [Phycisphaeraceae bacterium]
MKHRQGFTLIELLVVISIIALLISILLPALIKTRESGRTSACLSNTRQLILAAVAYSIDNEGQFPYQRGDRMTVNPWPTDTNPADGGNWVQRTLPYFSGSNLKQNNLLCPSSWIDREIAGTSGFHDYMSYLANGVITDLGGRDFAYPSGIIFIADYYQTIRWATIRPSLKVGNVTNFVFKTTQEVWSGQMRFNAPTIPTFPDMVYAHRPHTPGRNHGFMDGHALYIPWYENTSLKYGLLIQGEDKIEEEVSGYASPGRVGKVRFK